MTLYLESTEVAADRTIAEIQRVLSLHGATHILLEYRDGVIEAVSFTLFVHGKSIPFRLPCRWRKVYEILEGRRNRVQNVGKLEARARNIAWRIILRWIQAQIAFVETGMTKFDEIMMPFAKVLGTNKTFFELLDEAKWDSRRMLTAGDPESSPEEDKK